MTAGHWTPRANPWMITLAVMLATFMVVLGHVDRRCRVALHRREPRCDSGRIHVGAHQLSRGQRHHAAGQHLAFRLFWAQKISHHLHGHFHGGLVTLRPGHEHDLSRRRSRVVQGIGGGAMQPLSQAILLESFSRPNAARPRRYLALPSSWRPLSVLPWAAGLRTTGPGAGHFTSTFRWVSWPSS